MNSTTLGAAIVILVILGVATFSAIEFNTQPSASTTGVTSFALTTPSTISQSATSTASAAPTTATSTATSSSSRTAAPPTTSMTSSSSSNSSSATNTSISSSESTSSTTSTTFTITTKTTPPPPPPPPKFTLQIAAELQNGSPISGVSAQVAMSGDILANPSLPAALTLTGGVTYTVTVSTVKGYTLAHWSSGEASTTVSFPLSQNTSLIAFYKPLGMQTVQVTAKLLNGKSVVGVGLGIVNHQLQQASASSTDNIPANFTGKGGAVYTFTAKSAASVLFKYWNNDPTLTNASLTVTLSGNTTATAYFQQLAFPYKYSGTGNHTLTVVAHTMDGGLVIGAYFQVRINGQWNHVADGYTPGSVTIPDGSEEVVMYHCAQTDGCNNKFFVYRYWNNTSPITLTRWQYFTMSHDAIFNSFYEVIPANDAVHVTIEAQDYSTGQPIFVNCTCGALITVYNSAGTAVAQSLEPYSFWLWKGQVYKVTVGDLSGYTFMGWTVSSNGYSITFTAMPQGASDPYYQYFAAIYRKN